MNYEYKTETRCKKDVAWRIEIPTGTPVVIEETPYGTRLTYGPLCCWVQRTDIGLWTAFYARDRERTRQNYFEYEDALEYCKNLITTL